MSSDIVFDVHIYGVISCDQSAMCSTSWYPGCLSLLLLVDLQALQLQKTCGCIPAKFVNAHMPQLAALESDRSKAIQLQLVLLPPFASDATDDTPPTAVKNFGLLDGVHVRRSLHKAGYYKYMLSGLALATSRPCREGWYIRGVLRSGAMCVSYS